MLARYSGSDAQKLKYRRSEFFVCFLFRPMCGVSFLTSLPRGTISASNTLGFVGPVMYEEIQPQKPSQMTCL